MFAAGHLFFGVGILDTSFDAVLSMLDSDPSVHVHSSVSIERLRKDGEGADLVTLFQSLFCYFLFTIQDDL